MFVTVCQRRIINGCLPFCTAVHIGSSFYAGDQDEPPHVHVERDESEAKYWLDPVRLQNSFGFAANKLRRIQKLVSLNQQLSLDKWNEFFNR